jgi:hypothetical protein
MPAMTVIYALNFLDYHLQRPGRPIKKDLRSATKMGLLGLQLYCSIRCQRLIARIADHFNNIVAVALAFWAMTVFLRHGRRDTLRFSVGVGITRIGGAASRSMLRPLPARRERPRAGIYAIGTYLGVFLGFSSAATSTSTMAGEWRSMSPACPASRSPRCCG